MEQEKLDREEKRLLTSYEQGEWRSVEGLETEVEKYRGYAIPNLNRQYSS